MMGKILSRGNEAFLIVFILCGISVLSAQHSQGRLFTLAKKLSFGHLSEACFTSWSHGLDFITFIT